MDKLKVSALLIASILVTLVLNLALSSLALAPSPSEEIGYVIAGPEKTHSEKVIPSLQINVINSIKEQVGIPLVEHAFTLELPELGNYSMFDIEIEKGGGDPTPPKSIDVLWYTDVEGDINVIKWSHISAKLIARYDKDQIVLEEDEITLHSDNVLSYNVVQSGFTKIFKLESPLLDEVHSHSTIYIVYASCIHSWYFDGSRATKTVAYGKFTVDYGNAVIAVKDLSYYWNDWYIYTCSFSSSVTGIGTIEATVKADASYFNIAGCPFLATHFDSHPRVSVDAWKYIDRWSFGNKWLGGCFC
ncbi:MAG: hypothetical protein AVW05_03450 [Hadesarchaea archaeon DG-33]|nr:MAG: hypothetical protein AVW05_03450 [Hadesarchaea archaeon DG-33]